MTRASAGTKRILVVDSDPAVTQLYLGVLTSDGFEVDIAVNGIEAWDMIRKKEYDLVLIEIKIPIMNGIELYQCIVREHPKLANRVVFTSGEVIAGDNKTLSRNDLKGHFCPNCLLLMS